MADTIKLRVTRAHHTHQGVTYRAGETFDGTERLLAAFGDRLQRADPLPETVSMPAPAAAQPAPASAKSGKK